MRVCVSSMPSSPTLRCWEMSLQVHRSEWDSSYSQEFNAQFLCKHPSMPLRKVFEKYNTKPVRLFPTCGSCPQRVCFSKYSSHLEKRVKSQSTENRHGKRRGGCLSAVACCLEASIGCFLQFNNAIFILTYSKPVEA